MKITIQTEVSTIRRWGVIVEPHQACLHYGVKGVWAKWREPVAKKTIHLTGVVFGNPLTHPFADTFPTDEPRVDVTVEAGQ